MLNNIPVHCASSFSWSGRVGTAEASDLLPTGTQHRIYPDSTAVGFKLRSPVTGRVATMVQSTVEKDSEGEVVSTLFVSVGGTDETLVVRVFND